MFLTHSVMGWIVLTVLSLCLPVWSAVKVIQPYKVVSTTGTAQVQCIIQPQPAFDYIHHSSMENHGYPYPDPEEMRVTLLKGLHGTQELCWSIPNLAEQGDNSSKEEGQVQCSAQVRGGAVEMTVSGLKTTDTDVYQCIIEVFYPPPYLRLPGNGTLIHVLESPDCPERQIAHQSDEDEGDEGMAPVSTPVVVLVVLIVFVLIVIVYLQIAQCQQGKREIVRQVPGGAHKVDAVACCYENVA
ncbi:T-cell-specific surface glycoprotein CD28 Precursor [Channa argus]|uniref:T-cell-specific surface glycoprotein CD28 n=1 Tax=Channa argus TaxID=215402 RepID=A0A6G1PVX5_CHAAH|nr:T-cell-specific surface glycoprotein CD28 Precursor [Channa argus]KAK2905693.1 hypothetical protein Q8A73_009636 [Channa argus]